MYLRVKLGKEKNSVIYIKKEKSPPFVSLGISNSSVLPNRQLIAGSDVITMSEMFCGEITNKQTNKNQPTLELEKRSLFLFSKLRSLAAKFCKDTLFTEYVPFLHDSPAYQGSLSRALSWPRIAAPSQIKVFLTICCSHYWNLKDRKLAQGRRKTQHRKNWDGQQGPGGSVTTAGYCLIKLRNPSSGR